MCFSIKIVAKMNKSKLLLKKFNELFKQIIPYYHLK